MSELIGQAVDRFLRWKLPEDFAPDGGISFDPHRLGSPRLSPAGTNLLNAIQVEAMLEHVAAPILARVAELEAQTPSALKAKIKSAEARIQELEKWREDAALGLGASRVEALREAREVLRLCAVKPAYPKSAPEYEPVRALCERHGYGAVMACASSQWMESLERQGYPMEVAHVSGPCVGTVTSTINLITRALGE